MTSDDNKKGFGSASDNDEAFEIEQTGHENLEDDSIQFDDLPGGKDEDGDIDMDSAEDFAFSPERERKSSGGMKKMAAPLFVLVLALGLGGYIVLNPDVIKQLTGGPAPAVQEQAAAPSAFSNSADVAQAPVDPTAVNPVVDAELPQPAAVIADVPPAEAVTESMPGAADPAMASVDQLADPSQMPRGPETVAQDAPAPVADVTPVADATPPAIPVESEATASAVVPDTGMEEMGSADQGDAADSADVVQAASAEEAIAPEMPQPAEQPIVLPAPEQGIQGGIGVAAPQSAASAVTAPPAAPPVLSGNQVKPSGSDAYYDSGINLPSGPMTKEAIREVDPALEPGQKMIIAKKDYGKGTQESQVEAASRALKLQRYDAALEMYEQLYAKNKRDQRILMGLAVAQQYSGRPESAVQTYEALLDLDPNNADAMVNMLGLLRNQYPEVALRRLLDLHDKFPNNSGIVAQIGVTQASLGHIDDAIRYLQIASSLEPRNAQHLFNIAVMADRKGAVPDAIKYYELALEADAVYGNSRTLQREQIYDRLAKLRQR